MITLCGRRRGEDDAVLAPAVIPRSLAAPAGASAEGEFFGTYLARLPDLRGSPPLWQRRARPGVLASWLVTRVSCCWRQGGFASAQAAPAVFGTAPPRRWGPARAPGLTCGFWWQVQDSNLGRLSSAILQ
jgi:hypothetical protein